MTLWSPMRQEQSMNTLNRKTISYDDNGSKKNVSSNVIMGVVEIVFQQLPV